MKNIYLLLTDKASILTKRCKTNQLMWSYKGFTNHKFGDKILNINQHLYITSDDKFIKDEYVTDGLEVIKAHSKLVNAQGHVNRRDWKKIILTTDGDLIKNGIQAIDNEFLEWFVKNPSCEFIETKIEFIQTPDNLKDGFYYKIIIPKEKGLNLGELQEKLEDALFKETTESLNEWVNSKGQNEAKQRAKNYMSLKGALEPKYPIGGYAPGNYSCICCICKTEFTGDKRAVQCEPCAIKMMERLQLPEPKQIKCYCGHTTYCDCGTLKEPKQETLEEAAEREYKFEEDSEMPDDREYQEFIRIFKKGAKWQQERMYSEEDVIVLLQKYRLDLSSGKTPNLGDTTKQWLEQFKKK